MNKDGRVCPDCGRLMINLLPRLVWFCGDCKANWIRCDDKTLEPKAEKKEGEEKWMMKDLTWKHPSKL